MSCNSLHADIKKDFRLCNEIPSFTTKDRAIGLEQALHAWLLTPAINIERPHWAERRRDNMDEGTKSTVSKLPLLTVRASPRDKEAWTARLKEELTALIQYVKLNKEHDKDWFHVECNKTGTRWNGKCWYYYEQIRYEFDLEFEIPVTYPTSAPELRLPQLEGLTSKMYRGGKICQTIHFQPLWAKNVPRFGIAHSLALSLGPWLAAEIPDLVGRGVIDSFKK